MQKKPEPFWQVPREWDGQSVFVIAGGPSVTQEQVDKLQGRRVIAIKLSVEKAPFADVLFFADPKWFVDHKPVVKGFKGIVATSAILNGVDWLKKLRKTDPPGLCVTPDGVMVRRTSTTGAINLAVHYGAKQIVLLGADGKVGLKGETHHHAPHPLPKRPDFFGDQRRDLESLVEPLRTRGIKIFNTNSESTFRMFPFAPLDEVL